MQNVDQLRVIETSDHRAARDFIHAAHQCSGDRRARLLRFAMQICDAAECIREQEMETA